MDELIISSNIHSSLEMECFIRTRIKLRDSMCKDNRMNQFERYRKELLRVSNNIQFYKQKIAISQASNARMYYEKLLSKEAKRYEEIQSQVHQMDIQNQQIQPNYRTINGLPKQISAESIPLESIPKESIPLESIFEKSAMEIHGQPSPMLSQQPESATNQEENAVSNGERVFTLEELATYNGSNEQPAYVAVNGIVYDVSSEKRWGGGNHFSLLAGKDLSMYFNGCHGGSQQILAKLPKVGVLQST